MDNRTLEPHNPSAHNKQQKEKDEPVISKKLTVAVLAGAPLTLSACGAGQISQTANQVAAVDGASATDEHIAVRDVTVLVDDEGEAALKFTAINLNPVGSDAHTLKKVTVGDQTVKFDDEDLTIEPNCSLVADSEAGLDKLAQDKEACITYVANTVDNPGFALGGNKEVTFEFNDLSVTTDATIAAPVLDAGSDHPRENTPEHAGHSH